jgi:hypothetical protein
MKDNLIDPDQGGSNCQWVDASLGPTLGLAFLPVSPELIVTTPGPYTVPPFASRILIKGAGVGPIQLPRVSQWMTATSGAGQRVVQNLAGFGRDIWIKDFGGNASVGSPIVVLPFGSDTIDGLSQYSISTPGEILRLYGLTDLSGWYSG